MRKPLHRTRRKHQRAEKGSALLVSLMVMVGLSLLGLTFVAISETESAISVNERNKTQTTALAEAGAKTVVQWFQRPAIMDTQNLLPDNDDDFKTIRTVNAYTGRYKTDGGDRLCDIPFGPDEKDMFFGNEANADVIIDDGRNPDSTAFITAFNTALFPNDEGGRITSIRLYAPPMVGGIIVGGFYIAGTRYGIATIAVTAEKRNPRGAVIARSICRIVVSPFPLPGPTGAVQPVGGFTSNGSYEVHWGAIETEGEEDDETYVKREASSFPWFDPYDRAYIEYGYDSSTVWKANTRYHAGTYPRGETVRPSNVAMARLHEYTAIATDGVTNQSGATEPDWSLHTASGAEFWDNGVQWKERKPTTYQVETTAGTPAHYKNHNWLYEMLRREVDDPWFVVRTRGFIEGKDAGSFDGEGPHPYHYPTEAGADMSKADDFTNAEGPTYSHYFQYQSYNDKYLYKLVDIPAFDYDFWKAAAQAGRGQPGVFYLRHDDGEFTDEINTRTFEEWIDAEKGFLFFDSENNINPQGFTGAAKEDELVDDDADPCGAQGMVYANFQKMKSTGCGGTEGYYRMPGEPFRDIGYRKVNLTTVGTLIQGQFTTDAAGTTYVVEGAYDNKHSYQDLPWSNGAAVVNGMFDVCVQERTFTRESTGVAAPMTEWLPIPYYPGCTPGNNITTPACTCSEPHEPYLNLHYDGEKVGMQAYWDDPDEDSSTYPKQTDDELPTGTLVTCTKAAVASIAGQEDCATNAYDRLGALAELDKHAGLEAPGVVGVLYNEGKYSSTGNAAYYGSIVTGGEADPSGTQEVWFDECLIKGCWPPPGIPFPRVMITSMQIQ